MQKFYPYSALSVQTSIRKKIMGKLGEKMFSLKSMTKLEPLTVLSNGKGGGGGMSGIKQCIGLKEAQA
jgi:hypothetical protein